MRVALRARLEALGDAFWLRPSILVLAGIVLGESAVQAERAGLVRSWFPEGWLYEGGEAGARSLLGAVATSTIGVAGTVFSITVAALSLASAQMGPRLLRGFVRDAGNQLALGVFLGTFACALVVLRTVRATEEGAFVPHLGVTVALALALLCVATLVWFVHHVASGINVETVIAAVHEDMRGTLARLTLDRPDQSSPPRPPGGEPVTLEGNGYLRALDEESLAAWAAEAGLTVVLHVRPGDHVFPGVPVAHVLPGADEDTATRVRACLTVGSRQAASQDVEFAVRQLVEVGVRALSSGINDPFTAVAVLDRLGSALCDLRERHLPEPALWRDGRAVLFRRVTDYDGMCDTMFHFIRQSGSDSAGVLIHLVDVLATVLLVEKEPGRRATLLRHADLAFGAGRERLQDRAAFADLEARHAALPRHP